MIAYQLKEAGNGDVLRNRENFLANLVTNGLTLKSVIEGGKDGKEMVYVLVQTPIELLLCIAEKLKLKLPIQENDLYGEYADTGSILDKFKCFMPHDVELKRSYRNYFTAAYSTSLHNK